MLSQEIERKFTFYFCLPTDVFPVEDALSAYRWVRYQRAGVSQQTCLNPLIHPSLWRILHLNDISCRYTLTLCGSSHRKRHLLGPCVQYSHPISLLPTLILSSVGTQLPPAAPALPCLWSPPGPWVFSCSFLGTPKALHHSCCAPGLIEALGMPRHVNSWPQMLWCSPRMNHNCTFLPKGPLQ